MFTWNNFVARHASVCSLDEDGNLRREVQCMSNEPHLSWSEHVAGPVNDQLAARGSLYLIGLCGKNIFVIT